VTTAAPSPLWYLTRGTGLVTLVLLTASVVLGIMEVRRWAPAGSPRFALVTLHRAASLMVIALLAVHVLTAVLDSFAPIRLVDAVLPFTGRYRPLWLGLGALALDLLVAITVTSLVRRRLGLRAWRGVHWLAYACWPVALVHGWGTGSDARTGWMLATTLACGAAVVAAVTWRLAAGWPEHPRVRTGAAGACVGLVAFAAAWLPQGPLADGWARRSGTPPRLLASPSPAPSRVAARRAPPARPPLLRAFTSGLRGTVHQGLSARGLAVVDMRLRLTGGPGGVLRVRLAGPPSGGGVVLNRSAVTLGPASAPGRLQGRIDALRGSALEALVGSADGRAERLHLDLALSSRTVRGTVSGSPAG
jgi:DMSO/TMAO reductase YedYZ heme-binding membrane subunit